MDLTVAILTIERIDTDLVQVLESHTQRLQIGALIVFETVLLEKGLHTRRDLRMAELRHAREQVMFNLEIQVTHPKVDEVEGSGIHVHGVDCSIANPINLAHTTHKEHQNKTANCNLPNDHLCRRHPSECATLRS